MKKEVIIQRAEGLAAFAFALYTYNRFDLGWGWFVPIWFSIDLFMIGYIHNKKTGAYTYNLGHTYVVPFVLWIAGFMSETDWILGLSLIWMSHVGLDRALGYGLKLDKGFQHTHLGKIGKH